MDEKPSHVEQGQAERARRLRERIDQLKSGTSITDPGQPKSIKQQIGERVSELEKEKEGK
ncbi:MAG TPA: hypothetical protein VJW55_06125 [Candidatus Angelobacter sp.]|jgi:hypothetical protein|nr:hypothetical protein [Candidatus Angelobacter sp.]